MKELVLCQSLINVLGSTTHECREEDTVADKMIVHGWVRLIAQCTKLALVYLPNDVPVI